MSDKEMSCRCMACYRLPFADTYHYIAQNDISCKVDSTSVSDKMQGFLVVPFEETESTPSILIRPDVHELRTIENISDDFSCFASDDHLQKEAYTKCFKQCSALLSKKILQKVVLSRRLLMKRIGGDPWEAERMFLRACLLYPNKYVAMWSTPQTGTWLVASPETLLERVSSFWKTMSLAGTMTWDAGKSEGKSAYWSTKDKREQQLVTDYIYKCLLPFAERIELRGPFPTKAGDLAHLRTDFLFTLHDHKNIGDILSCLHPTPAVCGLPLEEAFQSILDIEDSSRKYYSGFSGPFFLDNETRLYVSLRCMEFSINEALLYAGGGLLVDSDEETEWIETCRKMNTMLSLFQSGSILKNE